MTLTVVVGASGSGKTTFLEHVHRLNKCVYIRQYHMVRPYLPVIKIPKFDPSKLPYWKLYSDEKLADGNKNKSYNKKIMIGGTMAGEFIPGLSGGQRKMLLFELVKQRTSGSSRLLLLFDEPFAGVTDDFVPFITKSLLEMQNNHNILLVTNDHVSTLIAMADSTITVSAVDRSTITVNGEHFSRELALHAVASGEDYVHAVDFGDLYFFFDSEVVSSPHPKGVFIFLAVSMGFFALAFWDVRAGSEPLVLVAIGFIGFFAMNPYLISLPDWRNTVMEEVEVLMHSSVQMNLALKSLLVLIMFLIINSVAFAVLSLTVDLDCDTTAFSICGAALWFVKICDDWSMTISFICFGLYTRMPLQTASVISGLPFMANMFFSTTFAPGAGVDGVKVLRYLFPRFYFWCAVPGVRDMMEACPPAESLPGLVLLTGNASGIVFVAVQIFRRMVLAKRDAAWVKMKRQQFASTHEFRQLQKKLYGDKRQLERNSV